MSVSELVLHSCEAIGLLTFEISSSAESTPGACDDAHVKCRLGIKPCPDFIKLSVPILVDAVEVFWSVQSYE
jgi:hypothetical protein